MSESEDKQARITIAGTPYVLPTLASMDLDEAIVLFDYSGLSFDQVYGLENLNPKVIKALLHIAIQRSDPALSDREIRDMLKVNMLDLVEQFYAAAEEAPDPTPAVARPPDDDSKRSSDEATVSSGSSGSADSEHSPEHSSPASTGARISDSVATSSPEMSVP